MIFLSTPSARRATPYRAAGVQGLVISIHALREEGDWELLFNLSAKQFLSTPSARRATSVCPASPKTSSYFYPRPPRGGRRGFLRSCAGSWRFLSTPSARRATTEGSHHQPRAGISIHALREEGDRLLYV